MSWGVCLEYDSREPFRRAWGYIIQECEIPNAWERGTHPQAMPNWDSWHFDVDISDPLQVPDPIFVFTPKDGTKLKGEVSLYDLEHPEQATYFFGSDSMNLNDRHLDGRDFTTVYIPESGHLHSFVAASMVIYDRKRKLCLS